MEKIRLNESWIFEKEGRRETVTLPHTWNNVDGQVGSRNYRRHSFDIDYWRGACTYTRKLALGPELAEKQLFLLFEGANAVAGVVVNGTPAGEHRGGYTAFLLDITGLVHPGENTLEVTVDNSAFQSVAPIDADFTFYGGLYRDVFLIAKEKVFFGTQDHNYRELKISTPRVGRHSAEIGIELRPENRTRAKVSACVEIAIEDGDWAVAASRQTVCLEAGARLLLREAFVLEQPHLWNGREDPFRYTVTARITVAGNVIEEVQDHVGLRFFEVDRDRGFLLNGRAYPLRGASRHQDRDGLGNALTEKEHREDFSILYDIGATAVRLAHYPQAELFYELCDEYGIVVWAEIPFVNTVGGTGSYENPDGERRAFFENVRSQLIELIRQNYNHPSICFWGLENEVHREYDAVMIPLMEELYQLARQEDPSRLITHAVNIPEGRKWKSDLYAWNYYPGWYGTSRRDLGRFMDSQRRVVKKPVALSEYGAGASIHQHSFKKKKPIPDGDWHPEEYQALCHESFIRQIQKRDNLWATFVWNLFDFASNWRHEGDRYGVNDKGLVTFDRKVKKDAYYLYQAAWSTQPVLHIASRRYDCRPAGKTLVKIYTNLSQIQLTCGGRTYRFHAKGGARAPFVFSKRVPLAPGENRIDAAAETQTGPITDSIVITGIS